VFQGGKSNEASIGQMAGKSVVLQKTKEIGAEVMQSVKEPVGIRSLNSALDSTKTTAAAEKESKLVLLEQRSGDGSAGSQMKVFSTPPGTHVNTKTASRVTSTLEEAVILSVEIPGTPKTSAGTADVMTKESTIIEAAPAVAVTIPPAAAEEETATGGKDVTGKDSLVEWVGSVVNISQGNVYYAACSVAGVTMRLQDCALFRPESPQDPPYIARLQVSCVTEAIHKTSTYQNVVKSHANSGSMWYRLQIFRRLSCQSHWKNPMSCYSLRQFFRSCAHNANNL